MSLGEGKLNEGRLKISLGQGKLNCELLKYRSI